MLVPALLLALSCAAALASEPPLPSGPQIAVPEPRLGKGGDCSSACEVCGCDREVDIDRGGNDVGPDGQDQGGGSVGSGHGPMATEEACCQFCRKIPTACALHSPALTGPAPDEQPEQPDPLLLARVLYKWESASGHNCWCSKAKGAITAQGPGTNRRSGSFARAECVWGWTFVIALSVLSVLYVGGGVGWAVRTQAAAPGIGAHPHIDHWRQIVSPPAPCPALSRQVKSQPFAVLCLVRAGSSRME